MNWRSGLLSVVLGILGATPALAKDPATWFPVDTWFYAEVNRPADLSAQAAALVKGTHLDNMISYMYQIRKANPNSRLWRFTELSMFGTFASPEAFAEAARIESVAVGLTGMTELGEPEVVLVLRTGTSNLPGFGMRAFLSSAYRMDQVGEVAGLPLYQQQPFRGFGPNGLPQPAAEKPRDYTATYAYEPGTILIGTSKAALTPVIQRMKGNEPMLSLSGAPGFPDGRALRQSPGIYFYVHPKQMAKNVEDLLLGAGSQSARDWEPIRKFLRLDQMASLCGAWTLEQGSMTLKLQARMDSGEAHPLLDYLCAGRVALTKLRRVPEGHALMITLSTPEPEARIPATLRLIESAAAALGVPFNPAALQALESPLGLSLERDIIAPLDGITVTLPLAQELPQVGLPLPMLVLHMDRTSAGKLENALPKLLGLLVGSQLFPITETIDRHKIRAIAGSKLPWGRPLFYGQADNVVVLGPDRNGVARALTADEEASMLAKADWRQRLEAYRGASVLGTLQWGPLVRLSGGLPVGGKSDRPAKVLPKSKVPVPPAEPDANSPEAQFKTIEAFRSQLGQLLAELPPVVVAVQRKEAMTTLTIHQGDLPAFVPQLINLGVDGLRIQFEHSSGSPKVFKEVVNPK